MPTLQRSPLPGLACDAPRRAGKGGLFVVPGWRSSRPAAPAAHRFLCFGPAGARAGEPRPPSGQGRASAAASTAPASGPASAREVRLAGDDQRTRLVVDLSRPVEFRAFTLANPARVIIDLTDVTFAFKGDGRELRRGLVSAYRFGVFAPGKARMVLDASDPVLVDKAFVLPHRTTQPARLVVDQVKTDADTFARSVATAADLAPPPAAEAAASSPNDRRPVVVIDPAMAASIRAPPAIPPSPRRPSC